MTGPSVKINVGSSTVTLPPPPEREDQLPKVPQKSGEPTPLPSVEQFHELTAPDSSLKEILSDLNPQGYLKHESTGSEEALPGGVPEEDQLIENAKGLIKKNWIKRGH